MPGRAAAATASNQLSVWSELQVVCAVTHMLTLQTNTWSTKQSSLDADRQVFEMQNVVTNVTNRGLTALKA